MPIYKCVVAGHAGTVAIRNILYYENTGIDLAGTEFGNADRVAELLEEQVYPALLQNLTNNYVLDATEVTVYNENLDLYFNQAFHFPVGMPGTSGQPSSSFAQCINVKFSLRPTSLLSPGGAGAPRKGYIALGPVSYDVFNEDGTLSTAFMSGVNRTALEEALAKELVDPGPAQNYVPVRAKQSTVAGVFKLMGYARVDSAAVSPRGSFRRSRMS